MNFDGKNRLILLEENEETLNVKELYYRWKEWSANVSNIIYPLAMRYVGGDDILDRKLGITYFLRNGWKIKPYSKNYTLKVDGNLYCEDGSSPFVEADGDVNVLIINTVSNLIDIVPLNVYNNITETTSSVGTANAGAVEDEDDDWSLSQ